MACTDYSSTGTLSRHMALTLTSDERTELHRRVRGLKIRAEDARGARVILMLANGDSYSAIEAAIPCYRDYINRWRRRFLADRLEGLQARYRGQPPTVLTATMEARILGKTRQAPLERQHALEYTQARTSAEASVTTLSPRRGSAPVCNRIALRVIGNRMTPTSRRKPRT